MKCKGNATLNEIKVNPETGSKEHIEHFDDFEVRCLTYDKRTKKYQFKTHMIKDSAFMEKLTGCVEKIDEYPGERNHNYISFNVSESDRNTITDLNLHCLLNKYMVTAIPTDGSAEQITSRFDLGKAKVLDYDENDWFDKFMRFLTSIRCGLGEDGVFIRLPFKDKTVDELEKETTKFYKDINKIAKDVFLSRFNQRFTYVQEVNSKNTWVYFEYKDLYYNSIHSDDGFNKFIFVNLMVWKEAIDTIKKEEYNCTELLDFRAKFEELKEMYYDGRL